MYFAGFVCDCCVLYGSYLVWKAIYLENYHKVVPEGSTAIITNSKGERYLSTEKDVYGYPRYTKLIEVIRTADDFEVKTRLSTKDRQVVNLTLNVHAKTTDVFKAFDIIGPGILEAVKVILGRDINLICREINSKTTSKS